MQLVLCLAFGARRRCDKIKENLSEFPVESSETAGGLYSQSRRGGHIDDQMYASANAARVNFISFSTTASLYADGGEIYSASCPAGMGFRASVTRTVLRSALRMSCSLTLEDSVQPSLHASVLAVQKAVKGGSVDWFTGSSICLSLAVTVYNRVAHWRRMEQFFM